MRICESHWKKMLGKPCAGKLHARFDERELELADDCHNIVDTFSCHNIVDSHQFCSAGITTCN
jgi:hypothetical protein